MGAPAHPGASEASPTPADGPGEGAADGGSTALPFPAVCRGTVTNPPAPVWADRAAAPASEPGNPSHS